MSGIKKVLLIAGGGTLGTYAAKELLRLGYRVDVLSMQAEIIDNHRFVFYKEGASCEKLEVFLKDVRYDGIINFMHYTDAEEYKRVHKLLIEKTDHLIFLSSYRVYADEMHPLREVAPRLIDVIDDPDLIENEDYAIPKSRCEDFLKRECASEPWTVVRPVISFSNKRFDLYTYSGQDLFDCIESGGAVKFPKLARKLAAGIDWAGNTGKLIAHLLFKKQAYGEAFTVSSAQNFTWEMLADCYAKLCGLKVEWSDEAEFIEAYPCVKDTKKWLYKYDRNYNRDIDNSKILSVTGLTDDDFLPIEAALEIELKKAGYIK